MSRWFEDRISIPIDWYQPEAVEPTEGHPLESLGFSDGHHTDHAHITPSQVPIFYMKMI